MTDQLTAALQGHIDAGTIPGAIALVGKGDDVTTIALGRSAVDGPALQADAIVRIQSMTKTITTVATLLGVQEGRFTLDDPVEAWLPELADPRVLRDPDAPLDEVVPAIRPITIRDLLINGSGYGAIFGDTPLARAMVELQVDAGPDPVAIGAAEWLQRLGSLPLVGQPGEVFRYHHSFGILGVLVQRIAGVPLDQHLGSVVYEPLGLVDTGLVVPREKADRLPAAYRTVDGGLVETDPAGGGFYVGPPPYDTAHGELVSTAADLYAFLRVLAADGRHDGDPFLDPSWVTELTRDQVTPEAKTPEAFFPGFWEDTSWGYGVGITTSGPHTGRYGWSGGQGTDYFIDPDGTVAILLTQVELGETMWGVLDDFHRTARTVV